MFIREVKGCLGSRLFSTSFSTTIDILSQETELLRYIEHFNQFDLVNVLPFRNPYFERFLVNFTFEAALDEFTPFKIQDKIDFLIKSGISSWKIVLGADEIVYIVKMNESYRFSMI